MKIVNGRDFWAGLMFIAIGLGFMIASRSYQMGSAVRMGPAYFPTVLGGILAVLGAIVFVRGFLSKIEHTVKVFPFRLPVLIAGVIVGAIAYYGADTIKTFDFGGGLIQYAVQTVAILLIFGSVGPMSMLIILAATIAFGYLLKPLGLVIATGILIYGSAYGGHEFNFKEVTIMAVALALFSVYAFVHGLGLPMNIWPELG